MLKYSWNQPICECCWISHNSEIAWFGNYYTSAITRLPVMIRYSDELEDRIYQCAYCGKPTVVGIFVRDNPEKVRYPAIEGEE